LIAPETGVKVKANCFSLKQVDGAGVIIDLKKAQKVRTVGVLL